MHLLKKPAVVLAATNAGIAAASELSQSTTSLSLPQSAIEGGTPLMNVLQARRSSREFAAQNLPLIS